MYILNYSHRLNQKQLDDMLPVFAELGFPSIEEVHQSTTFDLNSPLTEQVIALVDSTWDKAHWQELPFVIIPPALAPAAAIAIAHIHGLSGHFPAIVRFRAVTDIVTVYEFAEVINLDSIRMNARVLR